MKTTTIKLPEQLDAKLFALARKRGRSKSDVIRRALQEYVETEKDLPPVSCHDLGKHLAGCFAGPADLSTNPDYMDDYGK